jgi:hypothetical protein
MKVEGALYGLGFIAAIASVLMLFLNFGELGITVFVSGFISGLILIGFGKLLMMIEHYSEENLGKLSRINDELKQLSRIKDELVRMRYEKENNH